MTTPELGAFVKKNPISMGCAALCVVLGAALYFRSGEMPAKQLEFDEKSDLAARYANNLKNSAQLKEQLEAVTAANKDIDARLLRISQFGTNQKFFYTLVGETGVNLTEFRQTTTSPVKGKPFTPVVFGISAQGELPQLLQFLRLLENGTHYARVLSASFSSGAARTAPLTLSLNLELLGVP